MSDIAAPTSTTSTTTAPAGSSADLIWGFAPWAVFMSAEHFLGLLPALGGALAIALVALAKAVRGEHVHLFDIAGVSYFIAVLGLIAAVRPEHIEDWAKWVQAGSHGALTLIVFGSILVGRPFTESYARASVPQQYWESAEFRRANRSLSIVWGLALAVGTVSFVAAAITGSMQVALRIVVPFGALALAMKRTRDVTRGAEAA